MLPFINPLPEFFPSFGRKMNGILAFLTATAFIFCSTFITLNEKQVATVVFTIGMGISWLSTLMAVCNDVISDPFS